MSVEEGEEEGWYEDSQGDSWQEGGGEWQEQWEEERETWQEDPDWQEDGRNCSRKKRGRRWSSSWNEEDEESAPPAKRRASAPPPAPLGRFSSNGSNGSTASNISSRSDREWHGQQWQGWQGVSRQDQADVQQWLECSNVGDNVPGTRIVPCKTPFEGWLADAAYEKGLLEDQMWFGKQELLDECADRGTPLGLVIDLVNTEKYYRGFDEADGVEYLKIPIRGRMVPPRDAVEEIFDAIDEFISRRPDMFVGLHCTHGVNRTGFVVAAYLMTRGNKPEYVDAVAAFEKARGHKIDKQYLLKALKDLEAGQY